MQDSHEDQHPSAESSSTDDYSLPLPYESQDDAEERKRRVQERCDDLADASCVGR